MDGAPYDCIVIGAGPAGLSASLFLARYRYRVLTFHDNSPRNLYSHGVHGFLGHHGIEPKELLERGREEVVQHGGNIQLGFVSQAERISEDRFRVGVGRGAQAEVWCEARRLILATGLRDFTPECPGFREFYGRTVHHCPDCDAYEHRDRSIAVLGCDSRAAGFTLNLLAWTNRLTLVFSGDPGLLTAEERAQLSRHEIPVVAGEVSALEGDYATGQIRQIRLADGRAVGCDALFFNLGIEPSSDLYAQLGCRLDAECRLVWVDEHQQTSVPGVYAAGDLTPRSQLAIVAAAEGAMAAIHIHKSLTPADRLVS